MADDFFACAIDLFKKHYDWRTFIRSIGVSVSDFVSDCEQIRIGQNTAEYNKKVELQNRVNKLRKKYGDGSVRKAITLCDKNFGNESIHGENGIVKVRTTSKNEDDNK